MAPINHENIELRKKDYPALEWFAITPADGTDLDPVPRNLYVGGAGDISAVDNAGNEVLFSSVPAGTVLPIQPVQISSTGTTATNIVGLL